VKNLFGRFESLAEKRFDFGLCHGDVAPRNVVLDGQRMTLIDWGCAHAHIVPHFDFRELLRVHSSDSAEVRAFAAGYGASAKLNRLLPEMENVLLLCAYDVVRWAKDRAPAQLAEKEKEFRNFLERFQPRENVD
jgi:Ser/Thr protein kinase RdoA (MazF antagonist)